uniref:Nucleoside diphosphate kinase-like domain-containing protein n=1 Tax=Sarcophilus harrisii TaxID=9305 RepID=A0A7N4PSB5_SARHA
MAALGRGGARLLQLTLALIKPDAVAHPLILEAIHEQILSSQLLIVRVRDLAWRREQCQRFYQEHAGGRGREWAGPGVGGAGPGRVPALSVCLPQGAFSTSGWWSSWPGSPASPGEGGWGGAPGSPPFLAPSGPMRAYILAHEDAVQLWRTLMGPTKVFRARYVAPDSIRGRFGLTDTRNTTHGSDSAASARREIAAFFPDFDERRWYQEEEPGLRCGPVYYDPEGGVHCPRPAAPASDLA